jgi:hypothetical protein
MPPLEVAEEAPPAANGRRPHLAIFLAAAVILALIVVWYAGRSSGYDDGKTDAIADCAEGPEAGRFGDLIARLTAPQGTRYAICAVPGD